VQHGLRADIPMLDPLLDHLIGDGEHTGGGGLLGGRQTICAAAPLKDAKASS